MGQIHALLAGLMIVLAGSLRIHATSSRTSPGVLRSLRLVDTRLGWGISRAHMLQTSDGDRLWRAVTPSAYKPGKYRLPDGRAMPWALHATWRRQAETQSPVPAYVVTVARQIAVAMHDAHPEFAACVFTGRNKSQDLGGAHLAINEDRPVYFIVMRGHFHIDSKRMSLPKDDGGRGVTANEIQITVDAATHQNLDFYIHKSGGPPDLALLGKPADIRFWVDQPWR